VTNNKQYSVSGGGLDQDGIMVYNGTGWEVQTPQLNSTGGNRFLNGCLLLVAYKDRMIALNTLESSAASGVVATRYYNRARWSQNGVPYTDTIPGFDATAWQDDVTGKGGYIDAPTSEAIVSVGFYKDVLIVFFERSTWQLTYTGEAGLPFVWNKVNTSYGSESTFSTIQFDKGIFAVGDKAIVVSDNYNVVRIDEQIPLKVYQFHNDNNGPIRVHGIRDYYYRFAYWTYTDHTQNKTFPDKILVYNYEENAYSVFNDSYTCFGYYQPAEDLTWENANFSWVSANFSWDSNRFQSEFPSIIAGNQVGYVMLFNDTTSQDTSLYITNITQAQQPLVTIPNHNLNLNQYVKFANVVGMTEINEETGKIVDVIDANTIQVDIDSSAFTAYDIGGEVSVLGNINVSTKRYNPFFLNEKQVRMNYIDFYVDKTAEGEFNVDLFIDTSDSHPVATATTPTFQNYGPTISMDKMWQRVYLEGGGQFLQFVLYLNDDQMKDQSIQEANIVINAMNLSIEPAGNLLGYNL